MFIQPNRFVAPTSFLSLTFVRCPHETPVGNDKVFFVRANQFSRRLFLLLLSGMVYYTSAATAQNNGNGGTSGVAKAVGKEKGKKNPDKPGRVYYGVASYYAQKFNGRETANGDIYSHDKLTAACNVLPLGTWVRVTNLKNKRSVVVFVNDRLHPKNKRIVDLSYSAAKKLGYVHSGLAQVKVEVLTVHKPKK